MVIQCMLCTIDFGSMSDDNGVKYVGNIENSDVRVMMVMIVMILMEVISGGG